MLSVFLMSAAFSEVPVRFETPDHCNPVGYAWLMAHFDVAGPRPFQLSYVRASGVPFESRDGEYVTRAFARSMWPGDAPWDHFAFCLKHEPMALDVLACLLARVDMDALARHVATRPLGKYVRKLWFLFEFLTERQLDLPDLRSGNYVALLDPGAYHVGPVRRSPRHRVDNNLLGDRRFSPMVRRTERLQRWEAVDLSGQAAALVADYDPALLARAVNYLYARETTSSFEIEREVPHPSRAERFINLLRSAADRGVPDKAALLAMQQAIVDPRFCDADYRAVQNYVGETLSWTEERVHLIPPRPEEVPGLMGGLLDVLRVGLEPVPERPSGLHPVVLAAVVAFGLVYIHPFQDGNGRLHRWLIHYVLARSRFTPPGLIFPVSSVMLLRRADYDRCLEHVSRPLLEVLDWRLDPDGALTVHGEVATFYRYFDATVAAEYLFACIDATIAQDLRSELDFLVRYQRARDAMQALVELPDRKAALFVKLCVQNHFRLAVAKRKAHFDVLTDAEVQALEEAVGGAWQGEPGSSADDGEGPQRPGA
jgi:hypothetical protein